MADALEKRRFLDDGCDSESDDKSAGASRCSRQVRGKKMKWLLAASLAGNALMIAVCILLLSINVSLLSSRTTSSAGTTTIIDNNKGLEIADPFSPANDVIEYEYRGVLKNDTRFTGDPDEKWERNWKTLMGGELIRVSDDEMDRSGSGPSIRMKDGNGYSAKIGVMHSLHCVKKLKMMLYRDHFYGHLDYNGTEFFLIRHHTDHCLDFVRQSVMCHLDHTLYATYWNEERKDVPTDRPARVHKCVNWNKLQTWMKSREITRADLKPYNPDDGEDDFEWGR